VKGEWLPGQWDMNQTAWLTYGKLASFTRPGPAETWVIMDENPYSINDGSFAVSAVAAPGATYLIDFPTGYHAESGAMAFADGHAIIKKWKDPATYSPQKFIAAASGGGMPYQPPTDDPDCFFLAPITSARR